MRTLNLGILAHVDAGKTTLTERLLYTAGAIDHVGSVDAGTTQTDSLDLERERGITIRSAVASFLVDDLAVNLVDTPGHPDFIAEVERVLGVLDGAILVVSAVEGVQPQTPLLFRALQRLRVPTLIFVNKVDRAGADPDAVVETMRRRLSPGVIRMGSLDDGSFRARLTEVLAERDEAILRAWVGDEAPLDRLPACVSSSPRRSAADGSIPVYVGSAGRGIGIDALLAGIDKLLAGARGGFRRARSPAACSRSSAPRRASGSRTCGCSPATLRPGSGSASGRGGGEADVDQGVRAGRCAAT